MRREDSGGEWLDAGARQGKRQAEPGAARLGWLCASIAAFDWQVRPGGGAAFKKPRSFELTGRRPKIIVRAFPLRCGAVQSGPRALREANMSLDAKFELLPFEDAKSRLATPEDAGKPRTLVVYSGAELAFAEATKALLHDASAQIARAAAFAKFTGKSGSALEIRARRPPGRFPPS